MKRLSDPSATARVAALDPRPFDARSFDGALFEFLKMFGVAALGGLFFSLVAGLVVLLVASPAYAHAGLPREDRGGEDAVVAQAQAAHESLPKLRYIDAAEDEPDLRAGEILLGGGCGSTVLAEKTETDVYADVLHGTAHVRVTLTFRNPLPEAAEGLFLMTLPRGATAQRTIVTVGEALHDDGAINEEADDSLARPLGVIEAGAEASVVVDFEIAVADARGGYGLDLPFAAPATGTMNLMLDLDTDRIRFDGALPGMAVERNTETGKGFVVSAFLPAPGQPGKRDAVKSAALHWHDRPLNPLRTRVSQR